METALGRKWADIDAAPLTHHDDGPCEGHHHKLREISSGATRLAPRNGRMASLGDADDYLGEWSMI